MSIIALPVEGRPPARPPLRKIAIEEHVLGPLSTPADYVAHTVANSGVERAWTEVAARRLADVASARLAEMDEAGIDVAVLSLTSPGIEEIADPGRAVKAARAVNDSLAEHVKTSGGRFAAFASVPLQDVSAAVAELDRAVTELGLSGVLVNGFVGAPDAESGSYLDEERYDPFWAALERLDVPLYLHPRPPLAAVARAMYSGHPELMTATWGFAPETATHALRLVYGGVFDRHPRASVILGHMGETLPFFAWRIQRAFEYNPFDKRPARRLQDYLSDNFWITTSGNFNDQALITALLTVGADRILFASDYPFEMATDAARWIERAPISEGDRLKIARTNAARLFGLG
jgi:2,3-dihydroxybenzoate decarboxylase